MVVRGVQYATISWTKDPRGNRTACMQAVGSSSQGTKPTATTDQPTVIPDACAAVQRVVPAVASQRVVAVPAVQIVVAVKGSAEVLGVTVPDENVIAEAAIQRVVEAAAFS